MFPGIKVDGHGYKEGLDPNGGSLQSVIEKNIFVEADRGQPFRKKLAAVLARIRTPIPMPPSWQLCDGSAIGFAICG